MIDLTDKFLQLALLGANWVLWILVVLSIASVAIVFERWLYYRGLNGVDAGLTTKLNTLLSDGDTDGAKKLVKDVESPGAKLVSGMLEAGARGTKAASALLDGQRAGVKIGLERNLAFLGTVGSNAPFIGLFGTVLEILRVFNLLGEAGVASADQANDIMSGISEALVATAIGLLVAIPAVIAFNAFTRRVKRIMSEGDALAGMALSLLEGQSASESKS